jgi:capsular polysaccharide transport system permease protein
LPDPVPPALADIVDRIIARRGREHAYEDLDPANASDFVCIPSGALPGASSGIFGAGMFKFTNRILFLVLFLIPLLVITFYELALASNRYLSETSILISQENSGSTTFDVSFLGLPSSADDKDALAMVEFIMSRDMLHYLDEKLHLRDHYSASRVDWWARLSNTTSFEQFHDYMAGWLIVSYDTTSKLIRMQLQTFDQDYSKAVLEAILAKSQEFIDHLNAKVTAEQTRFFDDKMVESEARLKQAKQALMTFQRANRLLTTDAESAVVLQNVQSLEILLAKQQSEVDAASKTLNENAPRLQQMRQAIAALQNQISTEKERLSGISTSSISELDAQYREIQFNLEFVTTMYKSNLSQLEQARIEAARRVKFLVVVAAPSIADESQYPSRPYVIITVAIVFLALYFVGALILSILREHS